MAFPDISTLPTPPSRSDDSATFVSRANAFLAAFPTLQSEINSWATYAEGAFTNDLTAIKTAAEAARDAALAAQSAAETAQSAAETAEANAQDYADNAAGSANYKGLWSSLTGALNKPASVYNEGSFWALNVNLADVTASEPSAANTDWQLTIPVSKILRLRILTHAGL